MFATIVISLIIAAICAKIIYNWIKQKKNGGSCGCGCGCGCSGCSVSQDEKDK